MKPGREALLQREIDAARGLVKQHPLCASVSVHAGYSLSVKRSVASELVRTSREYLEWKSSYEPMLSDDAVSDAPRAMNLVKHVGHITVEVRRGETAMRCKIPPVRDYELPGVKYSVVQGMWFERAIDVDTGIVKLLREFAKELLLFVRMFCDLRAFSEARA